MNLLQALATTPFTWQLQKSTRPYPHNPKHTQQTLLMRVRADETSEIFDLHFRADTDLSVEQMVAQCLKQHFPDHPALRAWLDRRGNVPVALTLPLEELAYIGNPMHTALRKLADSSQSVMTWNALHHLHSEDRVAFWQAAERVVRDAFAASTPPTRRQLATTLRETLTNLASDQRYVKLCDEDGDEVKRKPLQEFALQMLYVGCTLTDMDEWMWGWLGYVVEDCARTPTPATSVCAA